MGPARRAWREKCVRYCLCPCRIFGQKKEKKEVCCFTVEIHPIFSPFPRCLQGFGVVFVSGYGGVGVVGKLGLCVKLKCAFKRRLSLPAYSSQQVASNYAHLLLQ